MEKNRFGLQWVLVAGIVSACGAEPPPAAEYPAVEAPPEPAAASETTAPPVATEPPPAPPIQVVAGESTPIVGDAPTLKIKTPASGKLIKTGDVEIKLDIKNWTLSADGPHVHLILDNEPYIAVRDASKPINVSALVRDNLGHDIAEGSHVLRLFPGHGHHESVKATTAFATLVFHYKKKTEGFAFDPKAPLLTFSRPKGCVVSGQRVLLDFFVSNTELSATGSRVHYSIDGTLAGDITSWAPHFIENLPAGEHTLQLTLANADGTPVAGMFNDTTRTITVATECATPAPAVATPAPATPAPVAPAATPAAPAANPVSSTPAAATPAAH